MPGRSTSKAAASSRVMLEEPGGDARGAGLGGRVVDEQACGLVDGEELVVLVQNGQGQAAGDGLAGGVGEGDGHLRAPLDVGRLARGGAVDEDALVRDEALHAGAAEIGVGGGEHGVEAALLGHEESVAAFPAGLRLRQERPYEDDDTDRNGGVGDVEGGPLGELDEVGHLAVANAVDEIADGAAEHEGKSCAHEGARHAGIEEDKRG